MEQTFEEYLKQARWDFAKVAETYPVEKHLQLRTAIDSLLIAYDQAVDQALSLGAVVGRSEQLHKLLQHLSDEDELIHNRTHQQIIDDFNKLV